MNLPGVCDLPVDEEGDGKEEDENDEDENDEEKEGCWDFIDGAESFFRRGVTFD